MVTKLPKYWLSLLRQAAATVQAFVSAQRFHPQAASTALALVASQQFLFEMQLVKFSVYDSHPQDLYFFDKFIKHLTQFFQI
jgi:hypothetical protein